MEAEAELHKQVILELQNKLEEHELELGREEMLKIESKMDEQAIKLEALEKDNNLMKQKNIDLLDELEMKNEEIKELENSSELKSSQKSLSDELFQLLVFKCEKCKESFANEAELKEHNFTQHCPSLINQRNYSLERIGELEKNISEQKNDLTLSLFKLKNQEMKEHRSCKSFCNKRFCRINHQKYRYIKSKSDELFDKLDIPHENPDEVSNENITEFGAIRKLYSCNLCDNKFRKQGDLKKHKKCEHKERERKVEK